MSNFDDCDPCENCTRLVFVLDGVLWEFFGPGIWVEHLPARCRKWRGFHQAVPDLYRVGHRHV